MKSQQRWAKNNEQSQARGKSQVQSATELSNINNPQQVFFRSFKYNKITLEPVKSGPALLSKVKDHNSQILAAKSGSIKRRELH